MGGSRREADPRRRVSARAGAAVAALATATTLAACGGDDSEALPTPAVASSTAAAPTATPAEAVGSATPQAPQRPRSEDTAKGREQFTTFVVARWGHALATNDATSLTELAPTGAACQGCRDLRTELAERRKQGWFVDFPGAEVERVAVTPGDTPGVWVGTARISVPESRSYFEDGTYRNDNEAHPNVDFTVRMRHQAGRFVLLAFSID